MRGAVHDEGRPEAPRAAQAAPAEGPAYERLGDGFSEDGTNQQSLLSSRAFPVIAIGFVGMIEYSLVMPTLAGFISYLGESNIFYGLTVASFSLVRLVLMPLFGVWCDRRPMLEPLVASVLLGIAGNILYGLAYGAHSAWMVLIGRVLVGAGASNVTVTTAYVARITEPAHRTRSMAMLNGINLLGIVVGPAVNLAINNIDWRLSDLIVFNKYSNAGFAMVLILALQLVVLLLTFEEPPKLELYRVSDEEALVEDPASRGAAGLAAAASREFMQLESPMLSSALSVPSSTVDDSEDVGAQNISTGVTSAQQGAGAGVARQFDKGDMYRVLVRNRLWVHFVVSFASNFVLCELEVALPALTAVAFGWDSMSNSVMYAVLGVAVALSLFGVVWLAARFSDRTLIGAGLVGDALTLVLACVALSDKKPPFVLFVLVIVLLIGSCPLCGSPNMGLYTKRLSEDECATRHNGLFIGLLQTVNGLSRTVAPIYAGVALDDTATSLFVYLGPLVVVCLAIAVFFAAWDSFRTKSLMRL
jgi:MFS family permease